MGLFWQLKKEYVCGNTGIMKKKRGNGIME